MVGGTSEIFKPAVHHKRVYFTCFKNLLKIVQFVNRLIHTIGVTERILFLVYFFYLIFFLSINY